VIGTYGSVLAVCAASLAIGQATVTRCGRRGWSWLSPAVGLALVCALCWATVRMPGDGAVSAVAVLVAALVSAVYLRGRVEGLGDAVATGLPVALVALAAASLPFVVEGRFGILGTSFNPDMSQHLLAAARLGEGSQTQLLAEGYPLGPHSIVVALDKGLGVGLVQGFDGLTIATAILASLTALGAFPRLRPAPRLAAALLVGLPYMVASYFAQGAFKETMQALFLLAFAIALFELSREAPGGERARSPLRAVPAAAIAVGSAFVYSFPGLAWLGATLVAWAGLELVWARPAAAAAARAALRPLLLALLVFAVLVAPEIGRMADFGRFETFDPAGAGLGNLFGQISPFEALGIWPSGDFRLTPGDGAVPAAGYYVGAGLALALLLAGAVSALARRESAFLAALAAALGLYAASRIGGTAYTAAKAVAMIAPPALVLILRPLLAPPRAILAQARARGDRSRTRRLATLAGLAFVLAAAGCSLLALANAPVGPTAYTTDLAELRREVGPGPTLVLAPRDLLANQHGRPYLAWELRGGRVCIEPEDEAGGRPPAGVRFVVAGAGEGKPYASLAAVRTAGPYRLWRRTGPLGGPSDCPQIALRQARQGAPQE
jgi:hypothetical protein